jgi:hypothetical protein
VIVVGEAAPALAGTTATGAPFDLASPATRQSTRSLLIEFHRGTW